MWDDTAPYLTTTDCDAVDGENEDEGSNAEVTPILIL